MNAIENVAEHINEMQSITEEFLEIFQELASANGSLEVCNCARAENTFAFTLLTSGVSLHAYPPLHLPRTSISQLPLPMSGL